MDEVDRDPIEQDPADAMHLDGNAVAGALYDWFGAEMTAAPSQCGNCGNVAAMAALLAFTQAPGLVLRCAVCKAVVIRIVETPRRLLPGCARRGLAATPAPGCLSVAAHMTGAARWR